MGIAPITKRSGQKSVDQQAKPPRGNGCQSPTVVRVKDESTGFSVGSTRIGRDVAVHLSSIEWYYLNAAIMDLDNALKHLNASGYCLWVGAGVTRHLASMMTGCQTPLWSDLADQLESELGGLQPPDGIELSHPERLQMVYNRMGRPRFQRQIRERLCIPLCAALVDRMKADWRTIPAEYEQLARLGCGASTIVNFNVESITSCALIGTAPACQILSFDPTNGFRSGAAKLGPKRVTAYHPHGSIDESGICVLTEQDYQSLSGTLALELAVHQAFGQTLAIVGMSLDDGYLLEQIQKFRGFIGEIIWFTPNSGAHTNWCWKNRIRVVGSTWEEFWPACQRIVGQWLDDLSLRDGWKFSVGNAYYISTNPTIRAIEEIQVAFPHATEEGLLQWQVDAMNRGEVTTRNADDPANRLSNWTFDELNKFTIETMRLRHQRVEKSGG